MTKREHRRRSAAWITAFYAAMFEGNVRYLGDGRFAGLSLIASTLPRQLGLDLF